VDFALAVLVSIGIPSLSSATATQLTCCILQIVRKWNERKYSSRSAIVADMDLMVRKRWLRQIHESLTLPVVPLSVPSAIIGRFVRPLYSLSHSAVPVL